MLVLYVITIAMAAPPMVWSSQIIEPPEYVQLEFPDEPPPIAPAYNSYVLEYNSYVPEYISPDYTIYEPPFSVPGQVREGFTIFKLLQAAGDLWSVRSVVEGARVSCERLGPGLRALPENVASEVNNLCSLLEGGQIDDCGTLWEMLAISAKRYDLLSGSLAIIPGMRCLEKDYSYDSTSSYDFSEIYTYPWLNFTDYEFVSKRVANGPFNPENLNPYDPCSDSGVRKVNNILFTMLDWLGPSLLDIAFHDDPYSICGMMRYILSMDMDDLFENIIGTLKMPLADILQVIQPLDVCAVISDMELDDVVAEAVGVAKALLVEFSGLGEDQLCQFLAEEQTREEYLQVAETMISKALFAFHDETVCNNVLAIVAPYEQEHFFQMTTGFDISSESERNEFCSLTVEACSHSSTYVPTPYQLPPGVDIEEVVPFQTPGEFLPGLSFVDLLRIDVAAFNSEKVVDSIAVTCAVFEDFAASLIDEKEFDVRGFCLAARDRSLGSLEKICLDERLSNSYYDGRPIGFRSFYPDTAALFAFHEIMGFDDISKDEICSAADTVLGRHSLRNAVSELAEIFLTEALPSVDGICKNWEEVMCYWKPFCPLPEPATEQSVSGSSDTSSSIYNYNPSPDYVEQANAEFDETASGLASLAWVIAGFGGRKETCAFVADAIDPLSGRGDRAAAAKARDRIFEIFYDIDRCSLVVDTTLRLIREEDRPYILTEGNTNIVYQLTGYQTSREFCEDAVRAFTEGGDAVIGPADGNQPQSDTYNVVADVVIRLQRVARSIF